MAEALSHIHIGLTAVAGKAGWRVAMSGKILWFEAVADKKRCLPCCWACGWTCGWTSRSMARSRGRVASP